MPYNHILIAVDLSPEANYVCDKARGMALAGKTRLSLMHVVEPVVAMPPYELPSAFPQGLEEQMLEHAKHRLEDLATELAIDEWSVRVELGSIKSSILDYAEEHGVDLIVMGSHGRHGVTLLLGSTTNAVMHHAKCDVLAVRIPD